MSWRGRIDQTRCAEAGRELEKYLGHGSPVVTLNTYAHLFAKTDTAAAAAIDRVLK